MLWSSNYFICTKLARFRLVNGLRALKMSYHIQRSPRSISLVFPSTCYNKGPLTRSMSVSAMDLRRKVKGFRFAILGWAFICSFISYKFFIFWLCTIKYESLVHLLEKGQVVKLVKSNWKPCIYVHLHEPLIPEVPETKTLRMVHTVPFEQFQESIRLHEDRWGIPPTDRISIKCDSGYRVPILNDSTIIVLLALCTFGFRKLILPRFRSLVKSPFPSPPEPKRFDQFNGSLPSMFDPFTEFNLSKSKTTNVKFKDVAGLRASKIEVMEFVTFLKNPEKYQALGAKLPKGALLLGPPGTGKTLLVKALANEADVPFFYMAGSEFIEVIGGLGASRIRKLFKAARATSPSIIFIDELDSLGRRRDSGKRKFYGSGEMEQTLNQLLVEMDGMDTSAGIIVFGATNRADLLDRALLRAGRFDRHIFIDLPDVSERKELFEMYLGKYSLDPTVLQKDLVDRLATWTPGMSGADIARLCNEAALVAARRSNPIGVNKADFEAAFERIVAGSAKRSNPLSPSERHVAAVQEAGRAVVAWLLPRTGLLPVKISIVPRTASDVHGSGGLGFTQLISEERHLFTSDEIADRMAVLLGGRAAEQIIFNAVSDASQAHLREANKLALKQVQELGMSKLIGHLSFETDSSADGFGVKPFSQRTHSLIELEAGRLVTIAFNRCLEILQKNKEKLKLIVEALVKKEVLTYDEIVELLGEEASTHISPHL